MGSGLSMQGALNLSPKPSTVLPGTLTLRKPDCHEPEVPSNEAGERSVDGGATELRAVFMVL